MSPEENQNNPLNKWIEFYKSQGLSTDKTREELIKKGFKKKDVFRSLPLIKEYFQTKKTIFFLDIILLLFGLISLSSIFIDEIYELLLMDLGIGTGILFFLLVPIYCIFLFILSFIMKDKSNRKHSIYFLIFFISFIIITILSRLFSEHAFLILGIIILTYYILKYKLFYHLPSLLYSKRFLIISGIILVLILTIIGLIFGFLYWHSSFIDNTDIKIYNYKSKNAPMSVANNHCESIIHIPFLTSYTHPSFQDYRISLKEYCYTQVATNYKSNAPCFKITNKVFKGLCTSIVATSTRNSTLCLQVEHTGINKICLLMNDITFLGIALNEISKNNTVEGLNWCNKMQSTNAFCYPAYINKEFKLGKHIDQSICANIYLNEDFFDFGGIDIPDNEIIDAEKTAKDFKEKYVEIKSACPQLIVNLKANNISSGEEKGTCESIKDSISKDNCYNNQAFTSNDTLLCNKITSINIKDSCFLSIIEKTKNTSLCNEISNSEQRRECNSHTERKVRSKEECDKIPQINSRDMCYMQLLNNNTTYNQDSCDLFTSEKFKQSCIFRYIVLRNNSAECISLHDSNLQYKCYLAIAENTRNLKICEMIVGLSGKNHCIASVNDLLMQEISANDFGVKECNILSGRFKDDCLLEVAIKSLDNSICKNITYYDTKKECIINISLISKDPFVCDDLGSHDSRGQCKLEIAIATKDIQICEMISNQFSRVDCITNVAIAKNDLALCDTFEDGLNKEVWVHSCYRNFATTTLNESLCALVDEQECINEIKIRKALQ